LPDPEVASTDPRLRSAVVGDVLDALGRVDQFLPAALVPLNPGAVLVGRAMPVLTADVFVEPKHPFGRLTEALDQMEPGEIYLVRGGRTPCAAWGEIMTTAAQARGAVGAIVDGFHRDTVQVRAMGWPVFSRGAYGRDARVRATVIDYRVPVRIGSVLVDPGELIVADDDGVVVIPADVEAEVLEAAAQKARDEGAVRSAIAGGMASSDAFAAFGVL
jgi:regulator of RNase E activity RraA